MYTTFDHTADVGIAAQAATREQLFAEMARGLFAVLLARPEAVEPRQTERLRIGGTDPAELLHDWLDELLFRFDAHGQVWSRFDVRFPHGGGLEASIAGERLDPNRHDPQHEVKAITYHELTVEPRDGGWYARVIVDI